jgi:hypothetical protein
MPEDLAKDDPERVEAWLSEYLKRAVDALSA